MAQYKFIMLIAIVTTLLLVQGCVVSLKEEGAAVRLVDDKEKYNCKFITTVTGSGSWGNSSAHDAEGAMNEMRNEAAKVGGNAVRVINANSSAFTTTAIGESLLCDFDE